MVRIVEDDILRAAAEHGVGRLGADGIDGAAADEGFEGRGGDVVLETSGDHAMWRVGADDVGLASADDRIRRTGLDIITSAARDDPEIVAHHIVITARDDAKTGVSCDFIEAATADE
jgi:hypothetical protein